MATQDQVNSFHQFALQQIASGSTHLSIEELFDQWLWANRTPEQVAEDLAALQASLDDFDRGERGRPAGEVTRKLREELGIENE